MNRFVKLLALLADGTYRNALVREGVAATVEQSALLQRLACRTVVDVGANGGQFALTARRCLPGARIISFEPLPAPARKFRRLFGGDGLTTLHECGAGAESGTASMHVGRHDYSSSLLPYGEMRTFYPGEKEARTVSVRLARLSDALSGDDLAAPALLKLDVEGYEIEALKGGEQLLSSFSWVLAEGSFVRLYEGQPLAADLIEWLRSKDWHLDGVYDCVYRRGAAVQANLLFRPGGGWNSMTTRAPRIGRPC